MKKSWVFVFLIIGILSMTNFVLAHFCQGDPVDTSKHGVEIDGECFNCGVDDGICPIDFGVAEADCPGEETDCGTEITATYFWSKDGTTNMGDKLAIDMASDLPVKLKIVGLNTGLTDENYDVDVHEYDYGAIGNDEDLGTVVGVVTSGKLIAEYNISEMKNITGTSDPENSEAGEAFYELYFEIPGTKTTNIPRLNITFDYGTEAPKTCEDYTIGTECNAVPTKEDSRTNGACVYLFDVSCSWNGTVCKTITGPETAENPEECTDAVAVSCTYNEAQKTGDECKRDDFFRVSYTPIVGSSSECTAWTSQPIPCPQTLKLPFFGIFEFLISLGLISIIYVFLIKKETL